MPVTIDAEHRVIESARRPKGWSKLNRPRKRKSDAVPPCPPSIMDDAPVPFNASYDPDDIKTCMAAARDSLHKKGNSFHDTLRDLCDQRGYNYQSFRRWLYRNGIRAYSDHVDLLRKREIRAGMTQIVITLTKDEHDKLREAEQIVNIGKRTAFARGVLMKTISDILKRGKK